MDGQNDEDVTEVEAEEKPEPDEKTELDQNVNEAEPEQNSNPAATPDPDNQAPTENKDETKTEDKINKDVETDSGTLVKEQKRLSFEYVEILTEIQEQNEALNDLKQRLIELAEQTPSTCTASEVRGIRCCLEQQKTKLKCLITKAMEFQQAHPSGPWEDIPLITNISEDCMPSGRNVTLCTAMCNRNAAVRKKSSKKLK